MIYEKKHATKKSCCLATRHQTNPVALQSELFLVMRDTEEVLQTTTIIWKNRADFFSVFPELHFLYRISNSTKSIKTIIKQFISLKITKIA